MKLPENVLWTMFLESSDFAIDMFAKMLETLLGICQEIRPYLFGGRGDSIRTGEYLS